MLLLIQVEKIGCLKFLISISNCISIKVLLREHKSTFFCIDRSSTTGYTLLNSFRLFHKNETANSPQQKKFSGKKLRKNDSDIQDDLVVDLCFYCVIGVISSFKWKTFHLLQFSSFAHRIIDNIVIIQSLLGIIYGKEGRLWCRWLIVQIEIGCCYKAGEI